MTESSVPAAHHRGLFLSFEGTEGSGKSTQMRLLRDRLVAQGHSVVENQEPGGTVIGREIRRILLDPKHSEMVPQAELLLMFASRAQAAAETILPALRAGAIVLSDRWTDSTLAYQGTGRELGFESILRIHALALGTLFPDLTLCTVLDIETGLHRASERNRLRNGQGSNEERLDRQGLVFHRRVLQGYETIAQREPKRFRMVQADGSEQEVAGRIWSELEPTLSEWFTQKEVAAR